jgi:hypothetical protein
MDNVQNNNTCIHVPSSQTFRSYLQKYDILLIVDDDIFSCEYLLAGTLMFFGAKTDFLNHVIYS